VIGLRSWISEGAIIEDALLMGADYYEVYGCLMNETLEFLPLWNADYLCIINVYASVCASNTLLWDDSYL
jgi:hypothetical protein